MLRKYRVTVSCGWFRFHIVLALCSNLFRVSLCHRQQPTVIICEPCWFCSEETGWVWTCLDGTRPQVCQRVFKSESDSGEINSSAQNSIFYLSNNKIRRRTFFISLNPELRQIELEWPDKKFKKQKLWMKVSFIYSIPGRCWCSGPFSTPGSTRTDCGFCWPQNTGLSGGGKDGNAKLVLSMRSSTQAEHS